MNDFERKLREQPFRAPPPDLRDAVLGASARIISPAPWTWRDWFWPSPHAWGAMAALWLIFALLSLANDEAAPPQETMAGPSASGVTLLSFHQNPDLEHVLSLLN